MGREHAGSDRMRLTCGIAAKNAASFSSHPPIRQTQKPSHHHGRQNERNAEGLATDLPESPMPEKRRYVRPQARKGQDSSGLRALKQEPAEPCRGSRRMDRGGASQEERPESHVQDPRERVQEKQAEKEHRQGREKDARQPPRRSPPAGARD
jgi:hypothetical protein